MEHQVESEHSGYALRCVRMTAINLGLRNHYGHVVCGNSLSNTASLIYETGRVQVWGNAVRKVGRVPLPDREPEEITVVEPTAVEDTPASTETAAPPPTEDRSIPTKQLKLF